MTNLAPGKLPPDLLESLLEKYHLSDRRLLVGPRAGEDAAVIDFRSTVTQANGTLLVAKTDPITFATDEIGWYAVHVNANDVATMGAIPKWFLATVLLPAGKATPAMADAIFSQMHSACSELGVALAGGHTEITHGLDRPIVCGTLLGEVSPDALITTAGAQIGDDVLFFRHAPIEGAALIAREKADALYASGFSRDVVSRAQQFLRDPGISIVKTAQFICSSARIHCLHDPTEGGIVTGLHEIARSAQVGMRVDLSKIPILPEAKLLCAHYNIDPLGTIASGGLLATVSPEHTQLLLHACAEADIPATQIGQIVPLDDGVAEKTDAGEWQPLRTFPSDEITRLF